MPYVAFYELFPELAKRETRNITVLEKSPSGLPPAEYTLIEMYCNERGCDCRRVMFSMVSSLTRNVVAVIAYGWESRDFYEKWLHFDDPTVIDEMQGPVLNVGSPQSSIAPQLLELVRDVVLQDPAYVQRLKTHYQMFRNRIDKKVQRKSKRKR